MVFASTRLIHSPFARFEVYCVFWHDERSFFEARYTHTIITSRYAHTYARRATRDLTHVHTCVRVHTRTHAHTYVHARSYTYKHIQIPCRHKYRRHNTTQRDAIGTHALIHAHMDALMHVQTLTKLAILFSLAYVMFTFVYFKK